MVKPTRRDPANIRTKKAITWLEQAQNHRQGYHDALQAYIRKYGDRHTPEKVAGVVSECRVCLGNGLQATEHEMLNHQTGSLISGVYSDHFPEWAKVSLRAHLNRLREALDRAADEWKSSGRTSRTFRTTAQRYRTLADGSVSYY